MKLLNFIFYDFPFLLVLSKISYFTFLPFHLEVVWYNIVLLAFHDKSEVVIYQKILFNLDEIFKEPLKKYEMFFSLLNLSCLESAKHLGRRPISWATLIIALVFKNLWSLPTTLSDLVAELNKQHLLSFILGLKPITKVRPVVSFYSFL